MRSGGPSKNSGATVEIPNLTEVTLRSDRLCCRVQEKGGYEHEDGKLWASIRVAGEGALNEEIRTGMSSRSSAELDVAVV